MYMRIVNKSKHSLPEYSTEYSAGVDLRANIDNDICLKPLERILVPAGLYNELPIGHEAQIRTRSELALKHGISVLNSNGTIDADYRGEIGIILANLSNNEFIFKDSKRIYQMVIAKHENVKFENVEVLYNTLRVEGGFGHTGKE